MWSSNTDTLTVCTNGQTTKTFRQFNGTLNAAFSPHAKLGHEERPRDLCQPMGLFLEPRVKPRPHCEPNLTLPYRSHYLLLRSFRLSNHGYQSIRNYIFSLLCISHSDHTIYWLAGAASYTRVPADGEWQCFREVNLSSTSSCRVCMCFVTTTLLAAAERCTGVVLGWLQGPHGDGASRVV